MISIHMLKQIFKCVNVLGYNSYVQKTDYFHYAQLGGVPLMISIIFDLVFAILVNLISDIIYDWLKNR